VGVSAMAGRPSQLVLPTQPQRPEDSQLHLEIKQFPPTSNHIYWTDWRRKRSHILTKEGETFQRRFVQEVNQYLPYINRLIVDDKTALYCVQYTVFFPHDDIVCRTYGSGRKGAAEDRYKMVDAENRTKLVSDSFAKALGLNDKYFFSVTTLKKSADLVGGVPQIHIDIWRSDPSFFGV
jgi:hypothetical protein